MDGTTPRTPRDNPRRGNSVAVAEDETSLAASVGSFVVAKPLASLLLAGSLGIVLGLFFRRS